MSSKKRRVFLLVILSLILQGHFPVTESALSDAARTDRTTAEPPPSPPPPESNSMGHNSTDEPVVYDDFDDTEESTSLGRSNPTANNMAKYVGGLISLLTLMYKFNGRVNAYEPDRLRVKTRQPESRRPELMERMGRLEETGKKFADADDRFDFPQKKFKQKENNYNNNGVDQEFQPLENYPPYNPLTTNTAETYGNDDRKTSYDVYEGQKTADEYKGNSGQFDSYSFPYERAKPVKASTYDLTNDVGTTWNAQPVHPVYKPWSSQGQVVDSYHPTNLDQGSYQTWSSQADDSSQGAAKLPDGYPIYHHDFQDDHGHSDPHYHEIERPADEDRVSKKPYSYYFLGRKLWYVPLLFSVYFIIYIGALVLKSVARHKIQFPEKLWDLHEDGYGHAKNSRRHRKIDEITENYESAVEKVKNKFM